MDDVIGNAMMPSLPMDPSTVTVWLELSRTYTEQSIHVLCPPSQVLGVHLHLTYVAFSIVDIKKKLSKSYPHARCNLGCPCQQRHLLALLLPKVNLVL